MPKSKVGLGVMVVCLSQHHIAGELPTNVIGAYNG